MSVIGSLLPADRSLMATDGAGTLTEEVEMPVHWVLTSTALQCATEPARPHCAPHPSRNSGNVPADRLLSMRHTMLNDSLIVGKSRLKQNVSALRSVDRATLNHST